MGHRIFEPSNKGYKDNIEFDAEQPENIKSAERQKKLVFQKTR